MNRSKLMRFILSAGGTSIFGLLALIFGEGSFLPYLTGGALSALGGILLSEQSSKKAGMLTLGIGGSFILNAFFGLGIMSLIGFTSLGTGMYFAYKSYKELKKIQ